MVRKARLHFLVVGFALLTCGALFLAGCSQSSSTSGDTGKALFEKKCSTCHATGTTTGLRHTKAEWESVVQRMQSMTKDISDEDAAAIVTYLSENYGE